MVLSRSGRKWIPLALALCGLCVVLVSACTLKSGRNEDQANYRLPTKLTIPVGDVLPGTDIRYERLTEQGAHLTIDGQRALKRKGDSLDWAGDLFPGVSVDLGLRVGWYTEEELHLVGLAKIDIEDIQPRDASISTSSPISYGGPVAYSLAKGAAIPGSTLVFKGVVDDGVELGGIDGYPYRKVGDSIFWEGTLRENVYLRLILRVVQFDEKGLRVAGVATLWLGS